MRGHSHFLKCAGGIQYVTLCRYLYSQYHRCVGAEGGFHGVQAGISLSAPSLVHVFQLAWVTKQITSFLWNLHGSSGEGGNCSTPIAEQFQGFYTTLFNVNKPKGIRETFWTLCTSRMHTCLSPLFHLISNSFALLWIPITSNLWPALWSIFCTLSIHKDASLALLPGGIFG